MKLTLSFEELVAHARTHCPFYRDLYTRLGANPATWQLTDLPVTDATAYWDAHTADRANVLAGPLREGIVIGSGGTTGAPKFVYYDDGDWDRGLVIATRGLETIGLKTGDRVANLFAAGEMYGSFLGAASSLKLMRSARVLQLPVSHLAPDANVVRLLRAFGADTLAGFPTRLLRLLSHMEAEEVRDVPIRRLIFAGESFYPAQRATLERWFPGVQLVSLGYMSVDAGMVAYADDSCGPDEHRVFHGGGYVEILAEDGEEAISEPGRVGRIVFTNLARAFQPVLRYPTGDLGEWVDPADPDARGIPTDGRRFVLRGRVQQTARLAYTNIEVADVHDLLAHADTIVGLGLRQHQIEIDKPGLRDRLTLRLVADLPGERRDEAAPKVLDILYAAKPNLLRMREAQSIEPVAIAWITPEELVVNTRTGKLRAIVDRRGS